MDKQIFINRSLRMDKIKCVGFDMDATLAIYNSPISEELAFNLSTKRLVDIGYPKGLQVYKVHDSLIWSLRTLIYRIKYKKDFVVRNAWFDKRFGNLLKTDEHCNILNAFHGFKKLDKFQVTNREGLHRKDTQQILLYSTIFYDCRHTIDWIHVTGDYKKTVTKNLSDYIAHDSRTVQMMQALSKSGKKLFLLTNSPWSYTNTLMSHVMGKEWQQLFDVVIVEGNKPKWFLQDIPFKEVDSTTGSERIGSHSGPFRKGELYSRGCASDFKQRMGLAGKDILYVGDHIFGDVLK
ncbi:HAD superfamily hydrolase, 5'-nucleotidase [Cooperia oncophora]